MKHISSAVNEKRVAPLSTTPTALENSGYFYRILVREKLNEPQRAVLRDAGCLSPRCDEVSVLSAEDFRCKDALGVIWESQPRRWWCGPGTWSTTSTASPAPLVARCWPPGTTLVWRTVWCTVACTLRLSSRENIRHILTTRTLSRTKAWARPTRSDYPTSTAWGQCRKAGPGRGRARGREPSWLLITQVRRTKTLILEYLCR